MARTPKTSKSSTKKADEAKDTPILDNSEDDSLSDAESESTVDSVAATDLDENAPDSRLTSESTEDSGAIEEKLIVDAEESDAQHDSTTDIPGVVPAHVAAAATPEVTASEGTSSGPSMLAMVFGGLIAGAIGFLVATFADQELPPNLPADNSELSIGLAEQSERLDAVLAEFESFRGTAVSTESSVDLSPLSTRQDATDAAVTEVGSVLETIQESLASLQSRMTTLEERPLIVAPDGSGAMEAQLESFRTELDAVTEAARAEIEAAQARASEIETSSAETASRADRRAALAELQAALENGAPYQDLLDRLPEAPKELTAHAETGIVTLSALQQSYPDAARITLQEAQIEPENGSTTTRLANFLKRQTNARSLSPREGADVDAVLSRAEATLIGGDLSAALQELSALPESVPPEMTDWLSDARARADAVAAAASLPSSTN